MPLSSALMRCSTLARWGGLLFILAYVFSNATLFQGIGVLYYAKHLAIYGVAALGAIWWLASGKTTVRGRFAVFLIGVTAIALPYLLRGVLLSRPGEVVIFTSYLTFGVAAVSLATAIEQRAEGLPRQLVALILGLVGFVALVSFRFAPGSLFNTYWGRPRLLLGFWHPKEVGAVVACATLLVGTAAVLGLRRRRNVVLWMFLAVVLLLVDSRNMFLFNVVFAAAYLCVTYLGYLMLLLGITVAFGVVGWLVLRYPELVDVVSSRRLSLWQEADYTMLGTGAGLSQSAGGGLVKFHIDNFYLEYLIENGIYTGIFAASLLFITGYVLTQTPPGQWRRLKAAAFVGLFFVSIFDAGMFSTGSIFNLTLWVYLLAAEHAFGNWPTVRNTSSGHGLRRSRLLKRLAGKPATVVAA